MKDFPSCFGENGVQVADFSSSSTSNNNSKNAQNLVTCVYQCQLRGRPCSVSVTWSKNLVGQCLSIRIDDNNNNCLCKLDVKPWLFTKWKGLKTLESDSGKIDIYWDLSLAKFGSRPEPLEGFYLGIVSNKRMVLLLGDMRKEAFKKSGATSVPGNTLFVAKKEHIFGKRVFNTKAQFCENGQLYDLSVECETGGVSELCLVVRVDTKTVMKVKHLQWKFRGNHTILVDGLAVEVFWDVFNWLFGTSLGNAVFMFKTIVSAEKVWASQTVSDSQMVQWSWSQRFRDSESQCLGFSLILNAWKNE